MKKLFLSVVIIFWGMVLPIIANAQTQGVAVNGNSAAPDPSAMLDVSSSDQGILIPRVSLSSTTSASPVASPATSLLVYNEATAGDVVPGFYYWDGSAWKAMGGAGDSPWTKSGSNIYQTDLADYVGIGTATPDLSASLDISSTTHGLLIPRMTSVQRDAIASPATGLQIYNLDCNGVNYYNGTCWLSMLEQLQHPGIITASSTVFCTGTTQTFSISAVAGATNYIWTVPPGASITSGQGSTSVSVSFTSFSGDVCVTAFNACSSSPESCVTVNVAPAPSAPGTISGPVTAMRGSSPVTYSVSPVTGATSYSWTIPSGASVVSGAGTSSIVVNYPCTSSSAGNVSVTASNSCGTSSSASTVAVTLGPIANAGPPIYATGVIGGNTTFPSASGGSGTYTYSWSPLVNLSSYTIANPTANCTGTTATYTLTVTDGILGCTATSTVVVTRGNTLLANAGPDQTLTGGAFAILGGNPTAANASGSFTYAWSPATGLSSTSVSNPTASPGTTTTYTVNITGSCGTSGSDAVTVTVAGTQQTFAYSGIANEVFTVPNGVTSIKIEAWGAQGGGSGGIGGLGGYASVVRNVTPGEIFYVNVGGQGGTGSSVASSAAYAALNTQGFNGGGAGAWKSSASYSAGGGGASDVRYGGTAYSNRIIVGGGGGGSGSQGYGGGGAGFPSGAAAQAGTGPAQPGTQTGSGTGGGLGYGASGIPSNSYTYAQGGGGAGYYGGGYGASINSSNGNSGGGGGSSYYDGVGGTATATGIQSGNGLVVITY